MTNNSTFWKWIIAAVIGALILVNVTNGKYTWLAITVILLGGIIGFQKSGGSLDDFIATITNRKGTS